MIKQRSIMNKELISFIKATIKKKIPIYNSEALTDVPSNSTRIEYQFGTFQSTGQIYKYQKDNKKSLITGTISEYTFQLVIRVFGIPEKISGIIGDIAGGIHTNRFSENYVKSFAIRDQTLRTIIVPVKEDGIIYNINQLTVDCYCGIDFHKKIDYFETVGKIKVILV